MINLFLAPAYPFACLIVMCVVFSFCDDHQLVDVSRGEKHPGHQGDGGSDA